MIRQAIHYFLYGWQLFKTNTYEIQRRVRYNGSLLTSAVTETGTFVDNGFHEIYVNTRINDGSDIAELMQFFKHSTGYHDNFPQLSNRVRLFMLL